MKMGGTDAPEVERGLAAGELSFRAAPSDCDHGAEPSACGAPR
jgi:hypothetical protein